MCAGVLRSTPPKHRSPIAGSLPPCLRMLPHGKPATSRRTVRSLGRWSWWTASRRAMTTLSSGGTGWCWQIHVRCASRSKYVAARGSGWSLRISPAPTVRPDLLGPVVPAGGRLRPTEPPCRCALIGRETHREHRRPRVVGGARRPAKDGRRRARPRRAGTRCLRPRRRRPVAGAFTILPLL